MQLSLFNINFNLNSFTTMKKTLFQFAFVLVACCLTVGMFSCSDPEAPAPENEVETFTDIEFIFTNDNDPTDVRKGIWQDADGPGPIEPVVLQHIELKANSTYTLTFSMFNNLNASAPYDVLAEIKDEEDEHQLFFEFTRDVFASPSGVGNIQSRDDAINYLDTDQNGLPIGLRTRWVTGNATNGASFRTIQGHQPGVKSATSAWNSGDIDWDITFALTVVE